MAESLKGVLTDHLRPFIKEADSVSVHRCPYGNREEEFFWGCNSEGCCWRGVECLYAYRLTGDAQYRIAVEQCLNYILGQNSTGYCYVTGFGSKPSSHPHHRLSAADGIDAPIPGLLAGGPNPGQQDRMGGLTYPSRQPDESYVDEEQSYASNEIAINWNAALVAMMGWIDARAN